METSVQDTKATSKLKRRGELPAFMRLRQTFDVDRLRSELKAAGLDDYSRYDSLKPEVSEVYRCGCSTQKIKQIENFVTTEEALRARRENAVPESEQYKQLYLQYFNPEFALSEDREHQQREKFSEAKKSHRVRAALDPQSEIYNPHLDERTYTLNRDELWVPYLKEIVGQFKAPVARTRLAVAMPGFFIKPHIDANTDYAIRVHIPVYTNDQCIFGVIDKSKKVTNHHMPADGSIWFLNTGWTHFFKNDGNTPRLHIMLALLGQDDLEGATDYIW